MTLYVDANVILALLIVDPLAARVDALFSAGRSWTLVASDFGLAEVSSVISRRVRMGDMDADTARAAFLAVDEWATTGADIVPIGAADIADAVLFMRRLDLPLRTPDAVHIAATRRLDATLATFDVAMARSARALGIAVVGA